MDNSEIVMYLGFFLMIVGAMIPLLASTEEIKTDCYDRYGSQIEGLTCNKTIISNGLFPLSSLLLLLSGFFLALYSIVMVCGEIMRSINRW